SELLFLLLVRSQGLGKHLGLNPRGLAESLFSQRSIHNILRTLDQPGRQRLGKPSHHIGNGFGVLRIVGSPVHGSFLFLGQRELVDRSQNPGQAAQGILLQSSQHTATHFPQCSQDSAKCIHRSPPDFIQILAMLRSNISPSCVSYRCLPLSPHVAPTIVSGLLPVLVVVPLVPGPVPRNDDRAPRPPPVLASPGKPAITAARSVKLGALSAPPPCSWALGSDASSIFCLAA